MVKSEFPRERGQNLPPKRIRKILVIGSTGHPREVQCFEWKGIYKVPNIADFDGVIIDMTSLTEEVLSEVIKSSPKYFERDYFLKLFLSGGKIFVICALYPPSLLSSFPKGRASDWWWRWSPIKPVIEEESGETFKDIAYPYKRYFSAVKSWEFTFKSFRCDEFKKYPIGMESNGGSFYRQILAKSRYDAILAAKIVFRTKNGEFCLLPPPTEISSREGINILLEDFFDIKTSEQPEPDWAREIKVPGENEIDAKIQKSQDKIEEERQKIIKWEKEKNEIIKFKKLLYTESNELEEIVRSVFREFGAEVIYPKEKNKEDGWIVTKYGKGVLEIKKDTKSASRKHTRQLDDWVGNCIEIEKDEKRKGCKGILVINHYGDKPLSERKEPFPSDVVEHAKKARPGNPFCLLTTVELFNAYCAFKKEEIDADTIFKKIFEAVGECKLLE